MDSGFSSGILGMSSMPMGILNDNNSKSVPQTQTIGITRPVPIITNKCANIVSSVFVLIILCAIGYLFYLIYIEEGF
jgi:hypothetical protein